MLRLRPRLQSAAQWVTRNAVLSQKTATLPINRAFHASAARQGPLLDAFLYVPHEMMSLLHASVPWYAAIPLTAFITRGLLVTTAGVYARALIARYVGLHPLRQALGFQKRHEILTRGNFRTPKEAVVRVQQEVKQITKELDKRWKVSMKGQISWTLLQFPVFLGMAEAIRQKCGARDGLLGLGSSIYDRAISFFRHEDAVGETDVDFTSDVNGLVVDSVPDLSDVAAIPPSSGADELAASIVSNASEQVVTLSRWFEPSLANEGFLWFQDLLLPDPTGALPFIVSGLMFCNIYFSNSTGRASANWSTTIRRSLLVVTLFVGPLCQDLPAALLLYWASSTSSVIVWNWWLDWRYPVPSGHTACKRPLLMPPTPTTKIRGP